jgi:SAM-dependent methyltransferase
MDLRFDPAREQAELAEYLGDRFQLERLWRHQQLHAEFAAAPDEQTFYRTSEAYLYDLTAFAMTGTKLPYLRQLLRHVAPGARLLDFGCGIGSDGLLLLEHGYRVEFADFENPSVAYLRWRLARRGLSAPVHDVDRGVPGGFDAVFAFDVIEHVPDPSAFLNELERRGGLVAVNLLGPLEGDQELHRRLPTRRLLLHAAGHRLRFYRRFHGRSHLVIYEPARPGLMARPLGWARLLAGRARPSATR